MLYPIPMIFALAYMGGDREYLKRVLKHLVHNAVKDSAKKYWNVEFE